MITFAYAMVVNGIMANQEIQTLLVEMDSLQIDQNTISIYL